MFLDGRLLRTIPADAVERLAASAEATAHSRRTSASDSAVQPVAAVAACSGCTLGCLRDFRSRRTQAALALRYRTLRAANNMQHATDVHAHSRAGLTRHGVQPLSVHIGGLSTTRHWLRFVPVGHHRSRVRQSP